MISATPSLALGLGDANGQLGKAAGGIGLPTDLTSTIGNLVKGALALVGTIFLLLTIYAGILWMTAAGKEEQIETSQKIVKAATIGLFITMAAYAITFFITSRLTEVGGNSAGGGAGATAPGGSTGLTDDACHAQAGVCDFVANVGQNCDPKGIDSYDGSSPGPCVSDTGGKDPKDNPNPRVCCVLKSKYNSDSSDAKCDKVGGTCQKDNCGGNPGGGGGLTIDAGFKCEDKHTPDFNCCKPR